MSARITLATAVVAGVAATLVSTAPAPAQAADTWGAIAWKYNGRAGGGYGSSTPGPAIREAKRRCGADCGYFTFHNSCGAIAYKVLYGRTLVGRTWSYPTARAARLAAVDQVGGWPARVNGFCSWG